VIIRQSFIHQKVLVLQPMWKFEKLMLTNEAT